MLQLTDLLVLGKVPWPDWLQRRSVIFTSILAQCTVRLPYMIRKGISPDNVSEVLQEAHKLVIDLQPDPGGQKVFCNGEDVTLEIRSREVTGIVSRYAQIEGLRSQLVDTQRQMALRKGVVMDGRDIGTTVLPDAEVKIFMTASVEERALRRFKELDPLKD